MAAVWYRARADLRRRWVGTVVLILLVGLASGVVLAAMAGARRTSTALDRFVEWHGASDLFMEWDEDVDFDRDAAVALPQVEATGRAGYALLAPSKEDGTPDPGAVGSINPFLLMPDDPDGDLGRPLVVEGELPDPEEALEVAVDEELAARRHLQPGSTLRMHGYGWEQLQAIDAGPEPVPTGPAMDLEVTAVIRTPNDVVPRVNPQDVVFAGTQELVLGPAWYERYRDEVAMFGGDRVLEVRLSRGKADVDDFVADVRQLPGGGDVQVDTESEATDAQQAGQRAVDLLTGAMWAFAALAAVTGTVVVGQALARSLAADGEDVGVLRALGYTSGSVAGLAAVRAAVVGAGGALVAVALAVALSPLSPMGIGRRAEIDPGLDVDVLVLALGALAVGVTVLAMGALTGLRLARRSAVPAGAGRVSWVAERLAGTGAPAPLVTGVRLALQPGRGRGAAAGVALAIVVLLGAVTFRQSLDHLIDTPELHGWGWDVVVGNGQDSSILDDGRRMLDANPLVGSWSPVADAVPATVDGEETRLEIVGTGDGPSLITVEGRPPARPNEVALGADTLAAAGASVGGEVDLAVDGAGPRRFTVAGVGLFPGVLEEETKLEEGALVTLGGAHALGLEAPVRRFLVDYAPGADPGAAFRSLQADFGRTVLQPVTPNDVDNLRRVAGLPLALAGLVGVLAVAALTHSLVVGLRRRRRELAVLRTVGFVRHQLGAVVVVLATTVVVVAVVVGVPLGVAAGRWSWRLVAESLGTPAGPVVPPGAVALVLAAALLVAATAASLPARGAARTSPAVTLRAE